VRQQPPRVTAHDFSKRSDTETNNRLGGPHSLVERPTPFCASCRTSSRGCSRLRRSITPNLRCTMCTLSSLAFCSSSSSPAGAPGARTPAEPSYPHGEIPRAGPRETIVTASRGPLKSLKVSSFVPLHRPRLGRCRGTIPTPGTGQIPVLGTHWGHRQTARGPP